MFLDFFPGTICGDHSKRIVGAEINSYLSKFSDSTCVVRFEAWPLSKHLMLKFEEFDIYHRDVELTIRGAVNGDVRSLFLWLLISVNISTQL